MSADALREALAGPVTDLLPCPFCGGEAAYAEGHVDHWYVRCSACGLRHPTLVVRERDPRPKLIAAWNRRAALAAQAARIAELEAENARMREAALFDPDGPCPICNGVEGCDHTLAERIAAARAGLIRADATALAAQAAQIERLKSDIAAAAERLRTCSTIGTPEQRAMAYGWFLETRAAIERQADA